MANENEIPIAGANEPKKVDAIGAEQIHKAVDILQKYKSGKANLEYKIIENEQWWKLRHWQFSNPKQKHTPATAWLWNVIVSKHADMDDAYPEPNILPREEGDKQEAEILSEIVPVIMEQNEFRKTYSQCNWYKLKQGASIYGIFWDGQKLNGLGDIAIKKIDAINVFWEPGISDIQESQNLFHTELVDNDVLKARYPQLSDKTLSEDHYVAKYLYDDSVDTSNKSTVIDWYYKKFGADGRQILHYVKFVGDTVIYATENETERPTEPVLDPMTGAPVIDQMTGQPMTRVTGKSIAERGLYDHGKYPFEFDSLFDIEGSPFGYGYTDICKDTQVSIDQLNAAIVKNALMGSKRRYFASPSVDINLNDFADWERDIVPVSSNMSEETLREIQVSPLPGTYVEILNNQIDMLKETSGNRDVNNGGTQSGVTAASALAVLQEAGNKGSRDIISTTYEAYKRIVIQVVELIRQFYDTPRQFRIIGEKGKQRFVSYDNSGIAPQEQGQDFGIDMGYRVPQFDIDVTAQKASPYNKMSRNELALQFYQLGFFAPQNADTSIAALDMMDFDGKQELMDKIEQNGTLLQTFEQLLNVTTQMAAEYEPAAIPMLQEMGARFGAQIAPPQTAGNVSEMPQIDSRGNLQKEEHAFVKNMRDRLQSSVQPNG